MKNKIAFVSALLIAGVCVLNNFSVNSQEEVSAAEKTYTVMPYGDSITDGYWLSGGYRTFLCNKLESNNYSEVFEFTGPNWGGDCYGPRHAGYSGYSIDDIPQSESISGQRTGISGFFENYLQPTFQPDIIMLQIGTNDILSFYDLENIGVRLENFVDTILTYIPNDGMLFLATIPDMDANNTLYINEYYFTPESMDEIVDTYNEQIKQIVYEKCNEGERIYLADINSVVSKDDLYDGVHPNEEGYEKMGDYWYDLLTGFYEGTLSLETGGIDAVVTQPSETTIETVTEISTEVTTETTTETSDEQLPYYGDINGDGKITAADIMIFKEYLLSKSEIDAYRLDRADLNRDGKSNISDLVILKRVILEV